MDSKGTMPQTHLSGISEIETIDDDPRLPIETREGLRGNQRIRIEKPEDFEDPEPIHMRVRWEIVRKESNTRTWISGAIVAVFVIWAIAGAIYLMFNPANVQVLITGSAFISGPLGIVIGYYFGADEDRKKS